MRLLFGYLGQRWRGGIPGGDLYANLEPKEELEGWCRAGMVINIFSGNELFISESYLANKQIYFHFNGRVIQEFPLA